MSTESVWALAITALAAIFAITVIVLIRLGRDVKAKVKIGTHEAEFETKQTPNNARPC
jgi:hypothetical protein